MQGTLLEKIVARAGGDAVSAATQVALRQRGSLRLAPGKPWMPFAAEQTIEVGTLGFRWEARIGRSRWGRVHVTDAFAQGRGRLRARLWGLVPLARAAGPEIDVGEALRYLAELPWCPPAYLGNPQLSFETRDATHLEVSTPLAGEPCRITLAVDPAGDVQEARAESRPRHVDGRFVSSPWSGAYADHGEWDGVRIPRRAEVTWHLPEGPFVCFRGEIVSFGLR